MDTVISHIICPHPTSISRMTISISHINLPYSSPISISDHILSLCMKAAETRRKARSKAAVPAVAGVVTAAGRKSLAIGAQRFKGEAEDRGWGWGCGGGGERVAAAAEEAAAAVTAAAAVASAAVVWSQMAQAGFSWREAALAAAGPGR